jgi:hypothetical protein
MNIDTNPSITTGKYYKDINNSLDKYVGIWKFLDGNKIFTIEFQKQTNVNFDNYQMDKIVGNYSYQVNGVMEVNTLNNSITQGSPNSPFHIELIGTKNYQELIMFFRDPVNSKWTSYVLIVNYFANNQTEVLNFKLGVTAYSNLDQDVNASQAIRIPNNILLVKQ